MGKTYIGIHNHKVRDVTCKYLATDVGYVSDVERCNVFIGINKLTIEVAMLYDDWFLVKWTLSCEGDTETRIKVYVKRSDGDKPWIPWCHGIVETTAFKTFSKLNRELQYLLISMPAESRSIHENNKLETMPIEPSDEVYINIRLYGYQWYEILNLPKLVFTCYIAILICGD